MRLRPETATTSGSSRGLKLGILDKRNFFQDRPRWEIPDVRALQTTFKVDGVERTKSYGKRLRFARLQDSVDGFDAKWFDLVAVARNEAACFVDGNRTVAKCRSRTARQRDFPIVCRQYGPAIGEKDFRLIRKSEAIRTNKRVFFKEKSSSLTCKLASET